MLSHINKIKGEGITITGKCWDFQKELQRLISQKGGTPTKSNKVTGKTTILIRGRSSAYINPGCGRKEEEVLKRIKAGQNIVIIDDSEFQKLVLEHQPARVSDRVAGQPIEWLIPPNKKMFQKIASIEGPLDREYSVKGRIEQSYLRNLLFPTDSDTAECALCGKDLPLSLLVAAHIKPRSECTDNERHDAENVAFGLCLLGCDALYERGYIAVNDKGRIIITKHND